MDVVYRLDFYKIFNAEEKNTALDLTRWMTAQLQPIVGCGVGCTSDRPCS
jgi:hypothetical protein